MGVFPDVPLDLTAQAAWGADVTAAPDTWTWTDLICDHPSIPAQTISRLLATPITVQQGVVVGAGTTQTTTGTLHLLNHDGALTPFLPTSPHSPYVDAGTPIRLARKHQTDLVDTFTRTAVSNGWGTADSGDVWTPVSSASAWSTSGTQGSVSFAAVGIMHLISVPRVIRDVDLTWDVACNAVATGATHTVQFNVRSTGSGTYRLGCAVDFRLAGAVSVRVRRYNGSSTVSTTVASTTVPSLTYAAGTMIRVRAQVIGTSVRMRAWLASDPEPSTWHVDFTETVITGKNSTPADVLQLQATVPAGNTNTPPIVFTFDNIRIGQAASYPLEGYITDVRPVFLPQSDGTTWSTVMIDVAGVGSRLEKNESPSFSPVRRSIQLAPTPPVAYWPLEDAEGSLTATSAFPGHPKMTVTGPAVFAFAQGVPEDVYQSRYGTKPMVSLAAGASISAAVPRSAVQSEWAVSAQVEFYVPDVPAITEMRILEWQTQGGTHARWAVVSTDTDFEVRAYDTVGAVTTVTTYAQPGYVGQYGITVEAEQNAGNIDVRFYVNDVFLDSGSVAGTLAAPSYITGNPDRTNTTASVTPRGLKFIVGHIRVSDDTNVHDLPFYADPATGTVVQAAKAWFLEAAHSRLSRLCAEERVPCTILGDPDTTGFTQLNAQRDGTFSELVAQAADSESGGLLYEAGHGYAYLPRSARYNQTAAMVIDLASYCRSGDTDQADILVPRLESRAANYWTVERYLGSTGSAAAPAAVRARRGTIAEQATLDVLTDGVLDNHAGWRLHLNVNAQGASYPSIPIDLAANPGLINDWLDCRIGSRVQRTNQPTLAGYGTVDQVLDGWSETMSPTTWSVTAAGSPAVVWDVAVADQPRGKADTDGTTIRAASDTATTLTVDVLAGPLWTTDPAQMPILVTAGTGEDLRITACSGGSSPQTWTVDRSLNGVVAPIPADTPASLTLPARAAL